MDKDTSTLAQNLRDARTRNAMTLAQVAKKTHLSVSFLSDLENGRTDPSLRSLGLLAECYHVPIATLLCGYRPEKAQTLFVEGDVICNVNSESSHYGRCGVFLGYWSDRYTFHKGRACDVRYEGVVDLYDRVETAQSVSDLERVEE